MAKVVDAGKVLEARDVPGKAPETDTGVTIPGELGRADLDRGRRPAPRGAKALLVIMGAVVFAIALLLLVKAHRMRTEAGTGRRPKDRIEKRVPRLELTPLPDKSTETGGAAKGSLPVEDGRSVEARASGQGPSKDPPAGGEPNAVDGPLQPGVADPSRAEVPKNPVLERRLSRGFGADDNAVARASAAATPAEPAAGPTERAPPDLKSEATEVRATSAGILVDRDYWLTQGEMLDCALETKIVSTVPGMATCHLTRDVYSTNGRVVLLDRGSRLVGHYQGGMQQGEARIGVVWTRAETPNGVVATLDSPGAGALGEAGVGGGVDQHFWDRFGAAILVSLVEGTTDAASARLAGPARSATVSVAGPTTATKDVVSKTFESTINMAPTLYVNQGQRIEVLVARDLNFHEVYGLARIARGAR